MASIVALSAKSLAADSDWNLDSASCSALDARIACHVAMPSPAANPTITIATVTKAARCFQVIFRKRYPSEAGQASICSLFRPRSGIQKQVHLHSRKTSRDSQKAVCAFLAKIACLEISDYYNRFRVFQRTDSGLPRNGNRSRVGVKIF